MRSIGNYYIRRYEHDFSEEDLEFEIRPFATEFKSEIEEKDNVKDIITIMHDSCVTSSFPQLYKLLILFFTIPVTVASAERSFSKLKLIKTYLRSKIAQSWQ